MHEDTFAQADNFEHDIFAQTDFIIFFLNFIFLFNLVFYYHLLFFYYHLYSNPSSVAFFYIFHLVIFCFFFNFFLCKNYHPCKIVTRAKLTLSANFSLCNFIPLCNLVTSCNFDPFPLMKLRVLTTCRLLYKKIIEIDFWEQSHFCKFRYKHGQQFFIANFLQSLKFY